MRNFYPDYYKKFKCIANKCPDSCCKDWDVVVDDDSGAFYENVNGELGERLKKVTVIDGDGDRIFTLQNGRCPFWNSDMLCDIYIGLGEEHLCQSCKSFPRITQDYTAFAEHMLSFACPEAARLMLDSDIKFEYETQLNTDTERCYNSVLMQFLLKARKATFDILCDTENDFSNKIKQCLSFNALVQNMLDEESFDLSELETIAKSIKPLATSHKTDCSFIFDIHKKLDIMSKSWLEQLYNTAKKSANLKPSPLLDDAFTKLAVYYVFRYYLTAVDSFDVLCTIKRIVCACIVNGCTLTVEGDFSSERIAAVFQRYSKEIEHSYENSEMLEDEFLFNPDFSAENLINLF